MPSVSKKQHNFMEAVAHNPSFAKKAGVPQSVGKDFSSADKGKKFSSGGVNMINRNVTRYGKVLGASKGVPAVDLTKHIGKKEGGIMATKKMAKGGMAPSPMGKVKTAAPSRDGIAEKGKTKGKQIVMPGNKMTGKK